MFRIQMLIMAASFFALGVYINEHFAPAWTKLGQQKRAIRTKFNITDSDYNFSFDTKQNRYVLKTDEHDYELEFSQNWPLKIIRARVID